MNYFLEQLKLAIVIILQVIAVLGALIIFILCWKLLALAIGVEWLLEIGAVFLVAGIIKAILFWRRYG
jgi:hypothetical protein